jgi:hypothetical protein
MRLGVLRSFGTEKILPEERMPVVYTTFGFLWLIKASTIFLKGNPPSEVSPEWPVT